jgi:hypothetical protein
MVYRILTIVRGDIFSLEFLLNIDVLGLGLML